MARACFTGLPARTSVRTLVRKACSVWDFLSTSAAHGGGAVRLVLLERQLRLAGALGVVERLRQRRVAAALERAVIHAMGADRAVVLALRLVDADVALAVVGVHQGVV